MKNITCFLLLLALASGVRTVQAQPVEAEFGPRLGFDIGGDFEEFFIGADGRLSFASLPVLINPAFDFYFIEGDASFFQLSANVLYEFDIPNPMVKPYVGGGIGLARFSVDTDNARLIQNIDATDTDAGLNLIGGATFSAGTLKPFAQAQITFGDFDLFTITGGLLFGF